MHLAETVNRVTMSDNVRVAVRVRPYNAREKVADSKAIIKMIGNQTIITNPATGEVRAASFPSREPRSPADLGPLFAGAEVHVRLLVQLVRAGQPPGVRLAADGVRRPRPGRAEERVGRVR